jgi:hypothetical protein
MAKKGKCDWCGVGVPEDDGFRLIQPKRNLGATFCRLEHVVPWLMKPRPQWHIWKAVEVPADAALLDAHTGEELEDDAIYLVRHRGDLRIPDGFTDPDSALAWAKSGGRYA